MKYDLLRLAVITAWRVIGLGQSLVRTAEGIEARTPEPYTVRCAAAWQLLGLGRRVEAFGVELEALGERVAARWGIDIDGVLAPLVASRVA